MEWSIAREPDDKIATTRISIGSLPPKRGETESIGTYLVFRGDPDEVIRVLETTLEKAKEDLPQGRYIDRRGRPQG